MIDMFKPVEAALVDRIPYWGFVAPDVVLTRAGHLLFVARIQHASLDGKAPQDLDSVTQSWQKMGSSAESVGRIEVLLKEVWVG